MRSLRCGLWVLVLLVLDVPALAQQRVGASVHVGTLGIGARVATPLHSRINLRGGIDVQPVGFEVSVEDVEFNVELPSPAVTATFDLYPNESGFRLSAGAVYFGRPPELDGAPTEEVELGDSVYAPAEVGTIRGSFGTSQFSPYLGLGWGNALEPGFGFALDLGVAFHGTPDFSFEATGPASSDAQFRSDLAEEAESINDDVPGAAFVYPILNLGFSYGF
ncbi:MAG: hypothetical protein OYM47_20105 [Gemmatimonadota bacterium]|nr:hypothetical protein [Gemmatimonadota bacterium]